MDKRVSFAFKNGRIVPDKRHFSKNEEMRPRWGHCIDSEKTSAKLLAFSGVHEIYLNNIIHCN
jgi:hypothetical protein